MATCCPNLSATHSLSSKAILLDQLLDFRLNRLTPSNHDVLRTSHSEKGMRIHWLMIGCQFVSHCRQIGLLQVGPEVKLGYAQGNHIRGTLGWKARSTVNHQRNLNHLTYPA